MLPWKYCCCWSLLYSAILRSRADSLRSRVILHEWLAFYSAFLNIHRSGVDTVLLDCYMAVTTWNCCHLGAFCEHHTTMHHVTSLHANPHRKNNVRMSAGFIELYWLFDQYLYTKEVPFFFFFFFFFCFEVAVLVQSLLMNTRKGMPIVTCLILFLQYPVLVYDVTDTYCLAQNVRPHGRTSETKLTVRFPKQD